MTFIDEDRLELLKSVTLPKPFRSPLPDSSTAIDYLMVLRGCACLGVFLGHFLGIGSLSLGALATGGPYGYVNHTAYLGFWRSALEIVTPLLGRNFVILFFVQSGYLMGKVFFEHRYDASSGRAAFYWARYLRLAPALYVNSAFALCFFFAGDRNDLLRKFLSDLFFVSNFTGPTLNRVTWSLAHEMQYYLVAPFVFLLLGRRPALLACIATILFIISPYLPQIPYAYTFLIGFAVNLVPRKPLKQRAKNWALICGLLGVHLVFNMLSFRHLDAAADLATALLSACLVWICECPSEEKPSRILAALMTTGYLTYGFYLWHYMVICTFYSKLSAWAIAVSGIKLIQIGVYIGGGLVLCTSLSYYLAWMSFIFVETKFRPRLYGTQPSRASI